ncbi:MAG: hypothetical protein ACO3ZZ_08935 [Solirubrobacterales bacterium]
MNQPRDNREGKDPGSGPLRATGCLDLAGSPVVLVEGLAGVDTIDELAAAFGSEDLGFRRRWSWDERADDLGEVVCALEFGHRSRRWSIRISFDTSADWVLPALVTIASGQLFSLADEDRPPPPAGSERELILPLMLDLDPAFLAAVGEAATGEPMELAVCVSSFSRRDEAEDACQEAAALMGSLGFVWRLMGPAEDYVLVCVAFSREGALRADRALSAGGGERVPLVGPLRSAVEARLWPGVEEGAAEAVGEALRVARGALLLTPEGKFEPLGPQDV